MTFQEEFLALLKKHHIAYDERYLWEWISAVPSGRGLFALCTQRWSVGLLSRGSSGTPDASPIGFITHR